MTDDEFVEWYGPWSPLDVEGVQGVLADFDAPWWIVGGYAIERFTGVHRPHEDVDVVVLSSDASRLVQVLARTYHVWANASGTLTPLMDGRVDLPPDTVQLWVRRSAGSPWEADFGVALERDGRWVWRHDPTVAMTLDELTWVADDGVRFARPEIVLAHKARWRQPKDELDLAAAWPLLSADAQAWLLATLRRMYPGHPWLDRLS
jgi:Aminoglycoside-2''-adenylyltransferase